jgi:anion transporter
VANPVDPEDQSQPQADADIVAAAGALAAAPIFAELTPLDRAKLAAVLEEQWIDAGSVVFEAGGHGDSLYILRSGTAERRVAGARIGVLTPPELFGELALLTDEPRSASVVAVTPLRLWVLPRARFSPLLRSDPELLLRLSASISRQLAGARRALGEMQRELDEWVAHRECPPEVAERVRQRLELATTPNDYGQLDTDLTTSDVSGRWGGLTRRRLIGLALAAIPVLLWWTPPPVGLATDGWRALLLLISAAILLALDVFPDAVVALVLLGGWVVAGLVEPRVALSGFAAETWLLVFAVLALGAAVGSAGLLYRAALAVLARSPAGFGWRCLALAGVGAVVTPTLPNATSRMALAAPLIRELAEALGYQPGGRAATGLALAGLIGFGQMSALFLTGSSVGLLVHGLLPAPVRSDLGFGAWFFVALPLHAVLFAAALGVVIARHRSGATGSEGSDRLALQRAVLGPMRPREWICLLVMLALIVGFLTEPVHGIHAAWIGIAALAILVVAEVLDASILRSGVNWTFLIFFGVITGLAGVFAELGIDRWLADVLAGPVSSFAASSLAFCLALVLGGFGLSFVVRWQAAAPLLTLVTIPVAEPLGVDPSVVAILSLAATQVWFLPYQSTVYLALYYGSGELFTHAGARPLALLWAPLVLLAVAAAVPVWQAMGLLR